MMVVALGPFAAGKNDAKILEEIDRTSNVFDMLQEGDILLLDRGFRDCIHYFKAKGLDVKMPALLQGSKNNSQLSTAEANQTRLITALRFIVEVRNGHMKTVFKIFNTVWNPLSIPHLVVDFQICAALLNLYHCNIESNSPFANEMATQMLNRLNTENKVHKIISKKEIQRGLKIFLPFEDFDRLPSLEAQHLVWISLGKYQIKQALSYCSQHIKNNDGSFQLFSMPEEMCHTFFASFHNDECKPILLLAQLFSRFRKIKHYNTFVLVNAIGDGEQSVLGYCCDCYSGLRTVGCCSHVMTIIWFSLYIKNRNIPNPAGFLDDYFDKYIDNDVSDELENSQFVDEA